MSRQYFTKYGQTTVLNIHCFNSSNKYHSPNSYAYPKQFKLERCWFLRQSAKTMSSRPLLAITDQSELKYM